VNSSDDNNQAQDHSGSEDRWLGQLVGGDGGDDMTVALRSAMLENHQLEIDEQAPADESQLIKLLQRCRHEGLIDEAVEAKKTWWPTGWLPAFVAVATVALLFVIVIKPTDSPNISEVAYRGQGDDKQAIHKIVADPMKQAIALQQELQQAGAKQVLLYQADDRWIISVQFTRSISDEIRAVMKSHQFNIGINQKLKVVFVPKVKK